LSLFLCSSLPPSRPFSRPFTLRSSPSLSSFFFYCSRHHRDLHSFPTRRSSDLCALLLQHLARDHQPLDLVGALVDLRDLRVAHRSEEHTSELQSRENLVCRLLLEKKKKKHKNSYPSTQQKNSKGTNTSYNDYSN